MEIIPGDDLEAVHHKKTKVQRMAILTKIFLIDIVQLIFFSTPIIIFYAWRQQLGFKTGFFCNDYSIRYPYVKSMISQSNIAVQTLLVPPVILTLVELLKRCRRKRRNIGKMIYLRIIRYLHGFFICMSFTYVPKLFRGSLRPHFMDVCDPNIDCRNEINQLRFIEDYECRGDNVSTDIYMSFPSVHTSAAIFVSIYLVLYLQKQIKWSNLRICLQFMVLLYGYSMSLSRIEEHYHHPSDVIAGVIIGGLSAYVSVKYLEDFFREPSEEKLPKSI